MRDGLARRQVPDLRGVACDAAIGLLCLLVLSLFAATTALAQDPPASRLDMVQKNGKLRVCTPGDYKPFSLHRPDGGYEGLDVDLLQAAGKAVGVETEFVKSSWPTLMKDFLEKCDVGAGGVSVTLDRHKSAFFSSAYMVNGKAPITKCENVGRFQTVPDIDKPDLTVIENPGGSNERFARANFKRAKIVIFNDNTTIFDEILKGNADVIHTIRARCGVANARDTCGYRCALRLAAHPVSCAPRRPFQ